LIGEAFMIEAFIIGKKTGDSGSIGQSVADAAEYLKQLQIPRSYNYQEAICKG